MLTGPVIPSPAAARPARAPAAARTLPLAVPPAPPPVLGRDVVYGLARVDRSGRVADRTVTGALGWRGGDRLRRTAEAGVVVIRRDPAGLAALPPRRCVPIPAALRHRCLRTPGSKSLRPELASDLPWRNGWTVAEQAGGTGGCPFGLSALSGRKLGLELLFEQLMAVHAQEHEQPRPPRRRTVPADPIMAALMARLTAARAPASLGFGVSRTIPGSTTGWCHRARTAPSPGRCRSCR